MLYELIAVVRPPAEPQKFKSANINSQVRPGRLNEVKEIAKTSGSLILTNAGVIRGLTNWGTFLLPKPKSQIGTAAKHYTGHYFIMRFDAGARTQHIVRKTLGLDPRLLRYSVVKMGRGLEEIKGVGGKVEGGGS